MIKKRYEDVHRDISSNPSMQDHIMTEKQLMSLLTLVSKYKFNLPNMTGWSIKMASNAIDHINKRIKQCVLEEREKPYDVHYLRRMFVRKYPEMFNAIIKGVKRKI